MEELEIWCSNIITGYDVSTCGRIKNNKTGNIIKPDKEEKGYRRLTIRVKGKRKHYAVHRLVALAFIPNPENKPQIDHIDGDKSNNRADNLRWCTNKENSMWRWEKIRKALDKADIKI